MLDQRIDTFLCVCRNMNYTKAARELGLTQPAVSQHIKNLEEYYGVKLFDYRNKKLSLTEQGEYLKLTMESFFHDSQRIKDDINRIGSLETIKIGATMSIGGFYLPDKLSAFIENHEELNIYLDIDDTQRLFERLDMGNLDFILCEGYFDKDRYDSVLFKRDEVVPICAKNYPLAKTIDDISSLFNERLFVREKGSGTREVLENMLHEKGFSIESFRKNCSINNPEFIVKMIEEGRGISFLYKSVVKKSLRAGSIRVIDIPGFHMEHEFNAVWKKQSLFEEKYHTYIEELI